MKSGKNTRRIILAIVVALFATLISYSTFSAMRKDLNEQKKLIEKLQQQDDIAKNVIYSYVISKKDLKAGVTLLKEDVEHKDFHEKDISAYSKISNVVNKVLLKDIAAGEKVTTSHVAKISNNSDMGVAEGYRALTLPAESFQGKSNTMEKGSYVDIYTSASDSKWFLEGVKILDFESTKSNITKDNINILNANSITFQIPVNDVADIIAQISKNKLVLVTRNSNDRIIRRATSKTVKQDDFGKETARLKSLPKMPATLPTLNSEQFSDLPAPVRPEPSGPAVEVIEANVKSKVTFD